MNISYYKSSLANDLRADLDHGAAVTVMRCYRFTAADGLAARQLPAATSGAGPSARLNDAVHSLRGIILGMVAGLSSRDLGRRKLTRRRREDRPASGGAAVARP
ncbi:hypothetical protein EVAR_40512_1 [Eumeta japonica]|uniref:Uncharacterized protein n=1 Tax=Eumeta variegata TaxID=151549 RepID=A0A4C1XV23_EUMVA|nr:hypothetical protein EVAR_40512_1 [Eumeta japonica]